MRYIRLRIANYRGVPKAEAEFAETGITLVQGPNEVGKTSLGEAISILFEYPDSSRARDITDIKPVDRDEGPEIELEAESGPYRFTYFKRYLKKPATQLTIIKPKAESLTSRQAHERAEAILRETLDVDLWKALSVRQGAKVDQPVLKGQTWLSEALDRAAGGHSADPRAESLFEVVHSEYNKYFNERGTEKKEITDRRARSVECQSGVQIIEQQMRELERDIERSKELKLELEALNKSEQDKFQDVEKHSANLDEVTKLENELTAARLTLELQQANERAAHDTKERRDELVDRLEKAKQAVDKIEESFKATSGLFNEAKEDLGKKQAVFVNAEKTLKEIFKLIDLRRSDHDYFRDKLFLEQLEERKGRIDQERIKAGESKAILETNKVDEAALHSIEEAKNNILKAKAKLEAKAPSVLLRGLRACKVTKDGKPIKLKKGEEFSCPVPDSAKFVVPDELEIEISAGSSIDTLLRAVENAESNLSELCISLGIDSADKANEASEERKTALKQIDNLKKVEKENLRDFTYEELAGKVLRLKRSVPIYLTNRVAKPPILESSDLTKAELTELDGRKRSIEKEFNEAKGILDEQQKVHDRRKETYIQEETQCGNCKEEVKRLENMLKKERADKTDAALLKELGDAKSLVKKAQGSVNEIDKSLKPLNPEQEKVLYETAKGSLERITKRKNKVVEEQIEVNTRLKINGEDGLWEKLNAAQTARERAEYEYASIIGQASAVSILYQIMNEERDKARHTYIAPLRNKIEALGRLVFDDTLQIDVNDNLQIVSRTLQGATVEFNSLSTGTKEQLSLIFRLACAILVAEDGGAPIMVDDALGYTDPERLKLMGAILAKAAKECQIVIFTCVPDRYSNIGAAKEIVMAK
jgi:DNA repair exonuclease SbcCD ATPase subunit